MAPRVVPKLVAPRANRIVSRRRVVSIIGKGLRSGVCWIAAPAGYGKTTAMADYLACDPQPHVWYRVDEGDQDIASFFHYVAESLRGSKAARQLPVFGPEYADQPLAFARRFFRAYFEKLPGKTLLVLDDLHYADVPQFHDILAIALRELPDNVPCACLSRTLPPAQLRELRLQGRVTVIDQATLEFSDPEARALIASHAPQRKASVDASAARGWAAGLVLLAERANASAGDPGSGVELPERATVFAGLAKALFETLSEAEQVALLRLSILPEIKVDLAVQLTGSSGARALLERLHQRQLLVSRGAGAQAGFKLHDLLREFLQKQLAESLQPAELARLRERAATLLDEAGRPDDAIDLALQARAWPLSRQLITARAQRLLATGRRATLIDWCEKLPQQEFDAWLCYWLGVANMADDAAAETWLERAWLSFEANAEVEGQCLTAARAVLSKTDSWRTHEGLATWTRRVIDLFERDFPGLQGDDQLLAWSGMLRAVDFATDYHTSAPAAERVRSALLGRLARRGPEDTVNLRLTAGLTLMEHAASTAQPAVFEQAVDAVREDLRSAEVSPWVLGLWQVAFGWASGRYFQYSKRGFPYASPEDALRAAVAIGEREALRGVEFGALYHLQLQMKMKNDFSEFAALVTRIAKVADSRYTTQVAVVADCEAALHTVRRNYAEAYGACARFNAAIEAANEPPIERWPHYITQFQVLLSDGKPLEAAKFLEGVLHFFDGGVHRRTLTCIRAAYALEAKWRGSPDYTELLRQCLQELKQASWSAVLLNLPELASELCADALEQGIESALCRDLIQRRMLKPPASRPTAWPWALRVHVLGEFRLERDGAILGASSKAPTRSLDILRALAIAKERTCSLDELYEWLWPDADGDQAKAACEQALHRLRKMLGNPDLVLQREGKLRLSSDHVWVDLDDWELRVRRALQNVPLKPARDSDLERTFAAFPGPLLQFERAASWWLPAAERVRSKYTELARRIGKQYESLGELAQARSIYLRAIDFYPTSELCYEALLRARLAQGDTAGAVEDYRRYERVLETTRQARPSPAIRALVARLLT